MKDERVGCAMIIVFLLVFFAALLILSGYDLSSIMAITTLLILGIIGILTFVGLHEKRSKHS